jgi:thiamine biosynthesis protein ThiS
MALTLIINGQRRLFDQLPATATLHDLVEALELKSDRIALEHNGEIASRAAWRSLPLADMDKIELVHFVGGGSNSGCVR